MAESASAPGSGAPPVRMFCPNCFGVYRASFPRCPRDGTKLEQPEHEPLRGLYLAGRYQLEGLVGEGAMGRVYRARHAFLPRSFAVKMMHGDIAMNEELRLRFSREAKAASRLDHPNVVSVLDVGETEGGIPFIVMEYLNGTTLLDLVAAEGPLSEPEVRWLARSAARALAHIHRRGIVHRDLKPENILIQEVDGRRLVKVVDFGIAQVAGDSRLTMDGHIVGTPRYMSPEQCLGQDIDARTDLHALGLSMFHAFTGRSPFEGQGADILREILSKPVPRLSHVLPEGTISRELDELVAWMSAQNRDDRPDSAQAVLRALEPAPETPPGGTKRASSSPPRPASDARSARGFFRWTGFVAASLLSFYVAARLLINPSLEPRAEGQLRSASSRVLEEQSPPRLLVTPAAAPGLIARPATEATTNE